jgi:integrase
LTVDNRTYQNGCSHVATEISDRSITVTNHNTVPLTDTIVKAATVPEGKSEVYLRDSVQPGFAVRLRASGAKTFVYLTTRPGRKGSHPVTIAQFPKLKVAAARRQAAMLAGERAKGIDLIADRRRSKAAAIKAANVTTLGDLIGPWPADGEEDNCRYAVERRMEGTVRWKAELAYLRNNLWQHRHKDIRDVDLRDVMIAVNKLNTQGKRGAAAGLWKHAFTFFGWTIEQGYIQDHPLANKKRKRKGSRAERLEREEHGRFLTDAEIVKLWRACDHFGAFGLLVRFCLLTGCRRREGASLMWSNGANISLGDRITFSASMTKMGKPHAVPRTSCSTRCWRPQRSSGARHPTTSFRHRGRGPCPSAAFPRCSTAS